MNLGFGLLSAQLRPGDSDWAAAYDETVRLAVEAERLGYSSVWTTEHHFVDDGYMPSLMVVSAAVAAATESIEIGTGVILAPLHDPIRLAEDAATVQLLSKGRFVLGLGLGWNPIEFEAFGADPGKRGRAMEEILEILPNAWTGEPFKHTGSVYDLPELGVRPTPHVPIPIVIGGSAEPAVRRAARMTQGVFANAPVDRFAEQVEWTLDELEKAGRDPIDFRFIHYSILYPADSEAQGWEEIGEQVWNMAWKYGDMEESATRSGPVRYAPGLTEADEQKMRWRSAFVGPSEQIVDDLRAIRDRVGVPVEFVARSCFHTLDYNRQVEVLQRLAEEVGPHL
ncbi:MAG TPA: LLM class flavin-dependent oxidoreductase [Acidimicrobiia bacterium]|nr:LLM class flavin-dependent oxidoreductase [Acidimicrobiia bacterium]